jgi:hypothetical protein
MYRQRLGMAISLIRPARSTPAMCCDLPLASNRTLRFPTEASKSADARRFLTRKRAAFLAIKQKEHAMDKIISAVIVTLAATFASHVFAAAPMDMSAPAPKSTANAYRFELAGPTKSNGGKNIVPIRLVHDGKHVPGAIIIQSRADMGPIGMAGMTAPIKSLGEGPPGTYRFEVENGSVWKKADNWALSFSAKVQGVAQTVTGSVTVGLAP